MGAKSLVNGILPLGNQVLLRLVDNREQQWQSSLIIPDSAYEQTTLAEVVAVGSGLSQDKKKKKWTPVNELKPGQIVLTARYGGQNIELAGIDYKLIEADYIFGVVE